MRHDFAALDDFGFAFNDRRWRAMTNDKALRRPVAWAICHAPKARSSKAAGRGHALVRAQSSLPAPRAARSTTDN